MKNCGQSMHAVRSLVDGLERMNSVACFSFCSVLFCFVSRPKQKAQAGNKKRNVVTNQPEKDPPVLSLKY